ncbi:MAG: helix-turn-helix domain-containing protein [Oscillospiraceae bacterium]
MRMDEIGYNHKHDRNFYIDRPNGAGDWLILVVKTPAIFRINGETRKMPSQSFIIYTSDFPQYYCPDCDVYYDDWIHFWPDDDEILLMKQLELPLNEPVSVADVADISSIARNMCFEHYSGNPHRKESVDLYFRLMLYKMSEKIAARFDPSNVTEGRYFEELLWMRESIYRWPGRDWSIDEMAKELSLSRSRFQHLYTDTFGVSINKDIIHSRLEKAAELLRVSDLSLSDIASIIGYHGMPYFLRQFKAAYDMTPAQYRKTYRETDASAADENDEAASADE